MEDFSLEYTSENIFSSLTLNFPVFMPSFLEEGLQSHRVTADLRQQVSLVLERQLTGQLANPYASPLSNLPIAAQSTAILAGSTIPSFSSKSAKHPPLTASNSVANCNAASRLKVIATREHRKLDRSVSEPADKSLQSLRQIPQNSSRYKTELCRPYEESGTCKYGDKCQFAHGGHELRSLSRHPKYKTELCRTFHSTGFCPYGPRCHFIHNSDDSKQCLLDTLQSSNGMPVDNNPSLSPSSLSRMSPNECDTCAFSLGSAGDMSPTSSMSISSGSPTSSTGRFFLDDGHALYTMQQVPQTAPPTMSTIGFFGGDYIPLKPLSVLPPLLPEEEYLSPPQDSDDEVVSSIDMLMSEMDLNSADGNNSDGELSVKTQASAAIDINRNLIRLPIFSRLSLGSSP